MRRIQALTLLGSVLLGGARCGSPTTSGDRPVVTAIVGQGGGQAASSGGTAKLQVPAGAVTSDVAFTLQQVDAPGPGAVGPVFEIGPAGTTFRQPATLTFRYSQDDIGYADPFSLRVATYVRGAWQPLPSVVNTVGSSVSAQITHLSPWTLVIVEETVVVMDAGTTGAGGSGDTTGTGGDAGTTGAGGSGGTTGAGGSGGTTGADSDTGSGGTGADPMDAGTDDAAVDA